MNVGWDLLPDKYDRRLVFVFAAAFVILFVSFSAKWSITLFSDLTSRNIWANDFFSLWSFAKFAVNEPVNKIYDDIVLHAFQMDFGAYPKYTLPFVHPPSFIFIIIPMGFASYYLAYAAWSVGTYICYFIASNYWEARSTVAFLIIFAPATIITFVFGQTGFLSAALMLGGFRLAVSRPVLSGALFGLASIKPQLGLLIPVALISARLWRTFAAASMTVFVLVFASGMEFGWSIWTLWFSKVLSHADLVAEIKLRYNPTIVASLISFGVSLSAARTIQLCVAVVVAVVIWMCFRRGVTNLATAALLVGTFLATPYAFVYDLPIVTNAVAAVLVEKFRTKQRLTIAQVLILALSLVLPAIMMETWRLSLIRSVPLVLLFGLIVRLILRGDALQQPGAMPAPSVGKA